MIHMEAALTRDPVFYNVICSTSTQICHGGQTAVWHRFKQTPQEAFDGISNKRRRHRGEAPRPQTITGRGNEAKRKPACSQEGPGKTCRTDYAAGRLCFPFSPLFWSCCFKSPSQHHPFHPFSLSLSPSFCLWATAQATGSVRDFQYLWY